MALRDADDRARRRRGAAQQGESFIALLTRESREAVPPGG
jgi:hypothetical protein